MSGLMDGIIHTFHHEKNKNNYNDSIRENMEFRGELTQAGS
jgi:hypothetical protein